MTCLHNIMVFECIVDDNVVRCFLRIIRGKNPTNMLWNICVTNDHGYVPNCRKHLPVLSSLMTYHRVCNQNNLTGATSGSTSADPSGAPEFIPGFQWGSCYSIFSFMCSVLQIVVCPFVFFLLAIVLFVLRYMDSDYLPLVSSSSSYFSQTSFTFDSFIDHNGKLF